jgi:hypothetical protein
MDVNAGMTLCATVDNGRVVIREVDDGLKCNADKSFVTPFLACGVCFVNRDGIDTLLISEDLTRDGHHRVIETFASGTVHRFIPTSWRPRKVAYSHHFDAIAVSSHDHGIALYDYKTGSLLHELEDVGYITSMAFSLSHLYCSHKRYRGHLVGFGVVTSKFGVEGGVLSHISDVETYTEKLVDTLLCTADGGTVSTNGCSSNRSTRFVFRDNKGMTLRTAVIRGNVRALCCVGIHIGFQLTMGAHYAPNLGIGILYDEWWLSLRGTWVSACVRAFPQ